MNDSPDNVLSVSSKFFEVRLKSVTSGVPLSFDLYLLVNNRFTLFRRKGDTLTAARVKLLALHGGEKFFVPLDQRKTYLVSLTSLIRDPSSNIETKSRFIKETAFLHVHDLFIKKDVATVVGEAKDLVEEMVSFISEDIEAVSSLMRLSAHDYYTYNHCVDVAVYSIALAKKLFGNDKKMLFYAGLGGLLHDIGKRKINLELINKDGVLTREEWDEIKKHPTYGREILADVSVVPDDAKLVVFEHHENYDGTGYPKGIGGEGISQLARVVAIADVFDALTTDRSYHKAILPAEALNTMYGMQPGKFDPGIFKSFNKNFSTKSQLALDDNFDACQSNSLSQLKRK